MTRKLVELDRVVDGAGGEAGGIGTEGEGSDAVMVVAQQHGSCGG